MKWLMIAAIFLLMASSAQANDSAVETAVGGLKLRKEHSVLMEKERLFISEKLVRVEYEFRNTSNEDVISEVAFPIPPYEYVFNDMVRDFPDFKAWVNGKPFQVEKEVRAFSKDREVTYDLRQAGITIENFGDFGPDNNNNQIKALKPKTRNRLISIGALTPQNKEDSMSYWPKWRVETKYHWRQKFPAGEIIRIKHEYPPVYGYSPVQLQEFKEQINDSCIDAKTFGDVKGQVAQSMRENPRNNNYFSARWVSYILTTANTWQTPIKDFELTIQGEKDELMSFCWDGPVEKTGDAQFRARKTDFVPANDLKVYFFRFWFN